jgi:hypothetical protein
MLVTTLLCYITFMYLLIFIYYVDRSIRYNKGALLVDILIRKTLKIIDQENYRFFLSRNLDAACLKKLIQRRVKKKIINAK